ncbi:3-dehydroquinate synthase [Ligilactobacillus sp.]|uniref:3-dehydroquinate synthase n=1 Tax=Ligilactobacillus sp. TaxID=2767921 RepID=UPI002FDF1F5B
MRSVAVDTENKSYSVLIEEGILENPAEYLRKVWTKRRCVILTDTNVYPLYAGKVSENLSEAGFENMIITVPAGERSKSWETLSSVISRMADFGLTRGDGLIALGGGVVGDLGGLCASLYMRGISFVQFPTSLLAQVDSSVGGKTAIDIDQGKNLVGTFHQPDLVLIDPMALRTLDERVTVEGYAEVVKCAAMKGGTFWKLVCGIEAPGEILKHAPELIQQSVAFKADVVSRDEKEGGLRRILNFGHSIGHAVELLSAGRLLHGEAVSIGLAAVNRIFEQHGLTEEGVASAVCGRLAAVGLPLTDELLDDLRVLEVMNHDKKVSKSSLTFVYLKKIGEPAAFTVSLDELAEFIGKI